MKVIDEFAKKRGIDTGSVDAEFLKTLSSAEKNPLFSCFQPKLKNGSGDLEKKMLERYNKIKHDETQRIEFLAKFLIGPTLDALKVWNRTEKISETNEDHEVEWLTLTQLAKPNNEGSAEAAELYSKDA